MDHPAHKQQEPQESPKSGARPPRSGGTTQDAVVFGLLWLMLLSCALFGVVAIGQGVWLAYKGSRSATWPSAPGIIIESRVHASQVQLFGRKFDPSFRSVIQYEFRVAGRQYTGDAILFGFGVNHPLDVTRRVQRYPLGRAASVYYDPDDPTKSVLEPGYRREEVFILLFSGIVVSCCAALLYWAITRGIPREAAKLSAQQAAASKDPPN